MSHVHESLPRRNRVVLDAVQVRFFLVVQREVRRPSDALLELRRIRGELLVDGVDATLDVLEALVEQLDALLLHLLELLGQVLRFLLRFKHLRLHLVEPLLYFLELLKRLHVRIHAVQRVLDLLLLLIEVTAHLLLLLVAHLLSMLAGQPRIIEARFCDRLLGLLGDLAVHRAVVHVHRVCVWHLFVLVRFLSLAILCLLLGLARRLFLREVDLLQRTRLQHASALGRVLVDVRLGALDKLQHTVPFILRCLQHALNLLQLLLNLVDLFLDLGSLSDFLCLCFHRLSQLLPACFVLLLQLRDLLLQLLVVALHRLHRLLEPVVCVLLLINPARHLCDLLVELVKPLRPLPLLLQGSALILLNTLDVELLAKVCKDPVLDLVEVLPVLLQLRNARVHRLADLLYLGINSNDLLAQRLNLLLPGLGV
mmetsp:Transcript_60359/g.142434  ORF Transcript_60359/g.142434 Transcript_60359/m.142434 type:complete len:425 (+) Transcript_60359:412-1686(+)